MNPKNTKKSLNHENADANTTCNFRDRDISRLGVAYLTQAIRDTFIASSIIVRLPDGITIICVFPADLSIGQMRAIECHWVNFNCLPIYLSHQVRVLHVGLSISQMLPYPIPSTALLAILLTKFSILNSIIV